MEQDRSFERERIKQEMEFVQFKMDEINNLIAECIEQQFSADLMADKEQIMTECVGLTYQILYFNYNEGVRRLKNVFT